MSLASLSSLVYLEGQGGGTLGVEGLEDGISPSLLIAFSSLSSSGSPSQLLPEFRQGECFTQGDSLSHRERSSQVSPPLSRLLQLSLRRLEGIGLVEALNQSYLFEPIRSSNSVKDGDHPVTAPCSSEG